MFEINKITKEQWFIPLSIFVYFFLICFRDPTLFLTPTLMNDDLHYFRVVYEEGFFAGLYGESDKYIYWNIWLRSFMFIAARVVDIEYAAYVIISGAIILYAVLCWSISSSASPFKLPLTKALALFMVALFPMSAPFMMLNYSHFFAALVIILLLVSQPKTPKQHLFSNTVLLIMGLSTPIILFLAPVFLLKYYFQRTNIQRQQLYIAAICCTMHITVYLYYTSNNYIGLGELTRAHSISIENIDLFILWFLNLSIVNPLFGQFGIDAFGILGYDQIGKRLLYIANKGGFSYWLMMALASAYIILSYRLVSGVQFTGKVQGKTTIWLLLILLLVSTGSYILALEPREFMLHRVKRYVIVPSTLIIWIILVQMEQTKHKTHQFILRSLVIWMLSFGFFINWVDNHPAYKLRLSWMDEVVIWKANPKYRMRLLPKGHILFLKPRDNNKHAS